MIAIKLENGEIFFLGSGLTLLFDDHDIFVERINLDSKILGSYISEKDCKEVVTQIFEKIKKGESTFEMPKSTFIHPKYSHLRDRI